MTRRSPGVAQWLAGLRRHPCSRAGGSSVGPTITKSSNIIFARRAALPLSMKRSRAAVLLPITTSTKPPCAVASACAVGLETTVRLRLPALFVRARKVIGEARILNGCGRSDDERSLLRVCLKCAARMKTKAITLRRIGRPHHRMRRRLRRLKLLCGKLLPSRS